MDVGMVEAGTAINVGGLGHTFGVGQAARQVLFDVALTVQRGEFVVLMGASGSGKTTLLTLLGCLRNVQQGSVTVLGQELRAAAEARLIAVRRRLGFIFQAHNLHESLTAKQNVMMGLGVHGTVPRAAEATRLLLGLLDLGERLESMPANLSGGQKQRVAVARALVGNPEIVFADEPTAALDKDSGRTVVNLLRNLGRARGMTTLMVTHDNRILDLADRVLTMQDDRIVGHEKQRG